MVCRVASPFETEFEKLPESLPVFPLAGVILLPGGLMPLNIFEPRYINLVQDALSASRLVGMVQPHDKKFSMQTPKLSAPVALAASASFRNRRWADAHHFKRYLPL